MVDSAHRHNLFRRRWLPPLVTGAIALLATASIVSLQRVQLNRTSLWESNPQQAEKEEALRLELLKRTPTFGFDNLIADWTFLNFLQYYGDTPARQKTGYSLSPQYFDIITRLDPRFAEVYLFVSGSVSYQLGKPDLAIQFMDRGAAALSPKLHPRAFTVWRFKGLDQLLLLGDVSGSVRSHEMAAKWAADSPYAELAPIFAQTADFLRKDPTSTMVRFQSWVSVYYQAVAANDKQTQARAKREILELGGQIKTRDGEVSFEPPPASPEKKQTSPQP